MFIPANIQWFIAMQVEELQVEGEEANLVYLNHILVKANLREMAYARAVQLGTQSNHQYLNSDEKRVTCTFRGLHDLFPIHDEMEDGAELSFLNLESLDESEILRLVQSKDELDIFESSSAQEAQQ